MSTEKLRLARRIYVVGHSASRALEWMQSHDLWKDGVRRDPRVRILSTVGDLTEVREGEGIVFQFLEGWKSGRSQEFLNTLWVRIPHTMKRNKVR